MPIVINAMNKARVAQLLFLSPASDAEGTHWVIMTPEKDNVSHDENQWSQRALQNMLDLKMRVYLPVIGYYKDVCEHSYLIVGMNVEDAIRYAMFFNQDSFLSRSGVYVRNQDTGLFEHRQIWNRIICDDDAGFQAWDRSVIECADGTLTFIVSSGE